MGGNTSCFQTFQPSTRIGGGIEKWWMDEVFIPKFLWFHGEVFPKWNWNLTFWKPTLHRDGTWTLGHPRNHFLQNHPTKKLPQSMQKPAPAVFIQLIRSTNHGEFQKWSAAKRCQHQNSPTKINRSNPFHLLTLLALPVWTITHPAVFTKLSVTPTSLRNSWERITRFFLNDLKDEMFTHVN